MCMPAEIQFPLRRSPGLLLNYQKFFTNKNV